jgi:hypothetical protein
MGNLSVRSNDLTVKRLRRIARILSVPIVAFTLVIFVGHLVGPEPVQADYPPIENLLPVLVCLSVLGLGIAWRWEGLGGAICVGFFVLHLALFWAIRREFFPLGMLVIFSPLVITGILFLVCWWKSRDSP